MALDEQRETDNIFTKDGLTFVIDNSLLQDAQPVSIDYLETERGSGYAISSNLSMAGGCGGSCSC